MPWEKSNFGNYWTFWGHGWHATIGDFNESGTTGHTWRYQDAEEAKGGMLQFAKELREMANEIEKAIKESHGIG